MEPRDRAAGKTSKNFIQIARTLDTPREESFSLAEFSAETRTKIKAIFDKYYTLTPAEWIQSMPEMYTFYTAEEIEKNIWAMSNNVRLIGIALIKVQEWGNIIGPDKTGVWLQQHHKASAAEQLYYLDQCLPFIQESERALYIEQLVNQNPAEAALVEKMGKPINKLIPPPSPWDRLMAIDPKDQILTQLFREHRDETNQNAEVPGIAEKMLAKFASYFRDIGMIEQAGLLPSLEIIVDHSVKGVRQEKTCLDLFLTWSLLRAGEPIHDDEQLPQTLAELEDLIFNELVTRLKLPQKVNPEQTAHFLQEMGGASAFATYFVQYEKSPEHFALLQEIFLSIAGGQFKEWKFRQSQTLEQLQAEHILPEKLTPEQYAIWQEDEETDSLESLSVSAEGVAQKVQQLIKNNSEHLYIGEFLNQAGTVEEAVKLVAGKQSEIGQQLATCNREYGALQKSPPTSEAARGDYEERLAQLSQQRSELELYRDFYKLVQRILQQAQLKPQEAASGYFYKGEKKTDTIEGSLQEISELLISLEEKGLTRDNLDTVLIGMISTYLQELKDKGLQSKQQLITTDSSSPKVFLEVGNNPVESCQNYAFGMYNECLLGYSEPNIKILIITNEKGNIIARSIFRLLTDTNSGEPALHVETVYSTTSSETVNNLIFQHGIKKAEKMGVKSYISERSQNDLGIEVEAEIDDQIVTKKTSNTLSSFNARAPFSYVDAAGGKKEKGDYQITGLIEIGFSVQTHISQIVEAAFTGEKFGEEMHLLEMRTPEMLDVQPEHLDEVVDFYNKYFPNSPHSKAFKESRYADESRKPVVLQLRVNNKIVGLLEAWNDSNDPTRKVLATVAVDEEFRGKGYARQLFEQARAIVEDDESIESWVVHFRDRNRDHLTQMYASWGFEELTKAEKPYSNGEEKWEMTVSSQDPWHTKKQRTNTLSPEFS